MLTLRRLLSLDCRMGGAVILNSGIVVSYYMIDSNFYLN